MRPAAAALKPPCACLPCAPALSTATPPLPLPPAGQHCWVGNGLGQVEVLELGARRFSGAIKGLSGEGRGSSKLTLLAVCGASSCCACCFASWACPYTSPARTNCSWSRLPGSARALAVHPGGEVLATVGLDRYLRLHSVRSRQLLAKVYIKTLPSGACEGLGPRVRSEGRRRAHACPRRSAHRLCPATLTACRHGLLPHRRLNAAGCASARGSRGRQAAAEKGQAAAAQQGSGGGQRRRWCSGGRGKRGAERCGAGGAAAAA